MPWKHEDWEAFEIPRRCGTAGPQSAEDLAREVLRRIPGRDAMTLCDVGGGLRACAPALAHGFAAVVETSGADCRPGPAAFDVVLALGTLRPASAAELDAWLAQAWAGLGEGGFALFTVPAASALGGSAAIRLGPRSASGDGRFHEVELQYRLRRAGFRGIRLRRVPRTLTGDAGIVVMAVRRGNN